MTQGKIITVTPDDHPSDCVTFVEGQNFPEAFRNADARVLAGDARLIFWQMPDAAHTVRSSNFLTQAKLKSALPTSDDYRVGYADIHTYTALWNKIFFHTDISLHTTLHKAEPSRFFDGHGVKVAWQKKGLGTWFFYDPAHRPEMRYDLQETVEKRKIWENPIKKIQSLVKGPFALMPNQYAFILTNDFNERATLHTWPVRTCNSAASRLYGQERETAFFDLMTPGLRAA